MRFPVRGLCLSGQERRLVKLSNTNTHKRLDAVCRKSVKNFVVGEWREIDTYGRAAGKIIYLVCFLCNLFTLVV